MYVVRNMEKELGWNKVFQIQSYLLQINEILIIKGFLYSECIKSTMDTIFESDRQSSL